LHHSTGVANLRFMTRYEIYKPADDGEMPEKCAAFVSSTLELGAYLERNFPSALWEKSAGLFDSHFDTGTATFDDGDEIRVRGIYPYSDDYVHLVIRRVIS